MAESDDVKPLTKEEIIQDICEQIAAKLRSDPKLYDSAKYPGGYSAKIQIHLEGYGLVTASVPVPSPSPRAGKSAAGDLTPIGGIATPKMRRELRGPSAIEQRLIAPALSEEEQAVLYQHSVLCQCYLPHSDPGDGLRKWECVNGNVHLLIKAGEYADPDKGRLVEVGLPWGQKVRLVLMHINQRAVLTQSPVIDVGGSLTEFIGRVLKLDTKGRNYDRVRNQVLRLSSASITGGVFLDDSAVTLPGVRIVKGFQLWKKPKPGQPSLWNDQVFLDDVYCADLLAHGVPLDADHIARLAPYGCMVLDIYTWLAHRLHRIPVNQPVTISWLALHGQFGQGYKPERMDKFRQVFRIALKKVLAVYKTARVEDDEAGRPRKVFANGKPLWREKPVKGLTLFHSPPPVRKLLRAGSE